MTPLPKTYGVGVETVHVTQGKAHNDVVEEGSRGSQDEELRKGNNERGRPDMEDSRVSNLEFLNCLIRR